MSDFTGLAIAGRIATSERFRLGGGAARLEPGGGSATQRGCLRRERRGRRQGGALRRRARPQGRRARAPVTAPSPLRSARRDDPDQDRADARRRDRPRVPARRGSRQACWRSSSARPPRPTASARCRAPRPTSAWSATRSAAGSAGSGRRYGFACNRVSAIELVSADGEARTVDAEQRRRPLLGAARRRRGLRDRHRAAPRPAADRRGLRGRPALPGRARRRRGSRLPRLGRERARGGHLDRPLPATAAASRRPRADSRPAAADDRRCLHRQPGRRASGRSRRCARSASRSSTPSARSPPKG